MAWGPSKKDWKQPTKKKTEKNPNDKPHYEKDTIFGSSIHAEGRAAKKASKG